MKVFLTLCTKYGSNRPVKNYKYYLTPGAKRGNDGSVKNC